MTKVIKNITITTDINNLLVKTFIKTFNNVFFLIFVTNIDSQLSLKLFRMEAKLFAT